MCPIPYINIDLTLASLYSFQTCAALLSLPCHKDADCLSTKQNFTCTYVDECAELATCPNAKFECKNTPGSVECFCRYKKTRDTDGCGDLTNPPGGNVFNVSVGWVPNRSDGLKQLVDILSMGFQNKFYNASKKDPAQGSPPGVAEYRINMSSDTPHWYIRDYMARCKAKEAGVSILPSAPTRTEAIGVFATARRTLRRASPSLNTLDFFVGIAISEAKEEGKLDAEIPSIYSVCRRVAHLTRHQSPVTTGSKRARNIARPLHENTESIARSPHTKESGKRG
ncbi:hypothetical protein F7725_024355, partial [Dissostichus mawsoni]